MNDLIDIGKALLAALLRGDYEAATADFDVAFAMALTAAQLHATWESIQRQLGPFQAEMGSRIEQAARLDVLTITCAFEKEAVDIRMAIDPDRKITGLQFLPSRHGIDPATGNAVPDDANHEQKLP